MVWNYYTDLNETVQLNSATITVIIIYYNNNI